MHSFNHGMGQCHDLTLTQRYKIQSVPRGTLFTCNHILANMAFVYNLLFGKQLVAQERVPTDEVIPLYQPDDIAPNRAISLEFTMVFDQVLL
jgi:hypothetical protein